MESANQACYTASIADWGGFPIDYRETFRGYVERGLHPGSGVMAILSNDLCGTWRFADDNLFSQLREILHFLFWYLPSDSWGSKEIVQAWMDGGGFYGRERGRAVICSPMM
jgi:hypothetical protein